MEVPPPKKVKIWPKTIDCIFINYAHNSTAYRFLVHESNIPNIHKNTIMGSRNASFFEDLFPCRSKEEPSSLKQVLETINENSEDQDKDSGVEPKCNKRERTENSFGPDFFTYVLEREPQTFKESINTTESLIWKEAIKSEIDSILHNHTCELVDLPPCCKPLSSKWVFKRKRKIDGSIDKYKARLVIKGYKQTKGLNYFDTYAPMMRISSIRMVLTIDALRNLEVHQMVMKTTFLKGYLDKEIYAEQAEGFSAPGQEKKAVKWYEKLDNVMMSHDFKINECDNCVYVKDTKLGYVIVCLYMDDMLIVISDDNENMLNSRFDMKDLELTDVLLDIKIKITSY